jgi:hypothetical protein
MTRSFSWLGKCPSLMNGGLKLVLWCDAVMQKNFLKEITNGKNKIKQSKILRKKPNRRRKKPRKNTQEKITL